MYFLEQIKTQFITQVMNYQQGPEWLRAADEWINQVEWLKWPDDVIHGLQTVWEEAHNTAAVMDSKWADLEARVDWLQGWGGDNEVIWDDWNDNMSEGREAPSEHPDSVGTATIENVQEVADRNGMGEVWNEEPAVWEDGQEVTSPEPSPEEIVRRTTSLESDRARTQERISSYPQWSPERQAAQQEMSAIQMLLNILQYGSINPPTWSVDSAWNPIEWWNSYSWGIGQPLSAEMLAEYGWTWHELASWLQQSGYPVFEGQPNYCGKNVWEAMNAFWYQGLPNHGRNGADWKTICEARPSQFKKIDCRPEDAPAGALISYARNSGGSEARQASGHIEICLGEWRGYYYGAVASQPGWSQKPPREWSYTIFMPTSKVA